MKNQAMFVEMNRAESGTALRGKAVPRQRK